MQFSNVLSPNEVTLFGIMILSKDVQFIKAVFPIVVKEPGKVIVFKDLQFLNAEVFITFRCFGNTMCFSVEQFKNALASMDTTGRNTSLYDKESGITIVSYFIYSLIFF